jgi:hypothetical protein
LNAPIPTVRDRASSTSSRVVTSDMPVLQR